MGEQAEDELDRAYSFPQEEEQGCNHKWGKEYTTMYGEPIQTCSRCKRSRGWNFLGGDWIEL